jgi:hypothetical protein
MVRVRLHTRSGMIYERFIGLLSVPRRISVAIGTAMLAEKLR